MVKIEKSYKDKQGKEVMLKTPKIKLGNNMGEEAPELVRLMSPIKEREVNYINKDGMKDNFTAYGCFGVYKETEVWVNLTPLTAQNLMKADYIEKDIIFERVIDGQRSYINFEIEGTATTQKPKKDEVVLTKDDVMKIFVKENKDPEDLITVGGKEVTFKEFLGEEVIKLLRD